ncbi:hypothetical protein SAMN04487969_1034 [Paenibacillus algorifonticola]|uniref:Uncharacterized protein n=1 Tax=Paenibacillus algorifonticola TaxID=684063 RepID=A0A1I2AZK9_9BACL|nr:hypothetical protein [Paenibacillus algorifonticola]SFE48350.1 hypothetical protein SAMN04487969_1034 [Paenibacillus algorifonticola]
MKFGIQGTVIGWQDPWAQTASEHYMRTGTGQIYPSQDPAPGRKAFMEQLKQLQADFYVHHVFPGLEGHEELLADMLAYGMELCLGNEYGNINGPWVEGTNRYDVPDEQIRLAAQTGLLIGLLYDEPEHLQINAGQYRKDGWFPHWGSSETAQVRPSSLVALREGLTAAVAKREAHVRSLLSEQTLHLPPLPQSHQPAPTPHIPLISEQVFPVLFHAQARGGMALCPKIMKESFQSLQLATALGAAKQYHRPLWLCADLWGPDAGEWPIRTPGFPGHSPEEFASALQMGYFMSPTHLFVENVDALLRFDGRRFHQTAFGEVWQQFRQEFVPAHPLSYSHMDATADIAFIHSDDSNYGQNERPFGSLTAAMPQESQSIFHVWYLLSHGSIPAHGSCMHIPGYSFPRHRLKASIAAERFPLWDGAQLPPADAAAAVHPLFFPLHHVLVYDEFVTEPHLAGAKLIIAAGTSLSSGTLRAIRRRAEVAGAVVLIAQWLLPEAWKQRCTFDGGGVWQPTCDFLSEETAELARPFLGQPDCWAQRFGDKEVHFHKGDQGGFTLNIELYG